MNKIQKDVHIVHRLDKKASGLMIVATEKSFSRQIGKVIQDNNLNKSYHVISEGVPKTLLNQAADFKDFILWRFIGMYFVWIKSQIPASKTNQYKIIKQIYFNTQLKKEDKKIAVVDFFKELKSESVHVYVQVLCDFLIPQNYILLSHLFGIQNNILSKMNFENKKQRSFVSDWQIDEKIDSNKELIKDLSNLKMTETQYTLLKIYKYNQITKEGTVFDLKKEMNKFVSKSKEFTDFDRMSNFFLEIIKFTSLEENESLYSEQKFTILKGKRHQIRVIAGRILESPILFDTLYGYNHQNNINKHIKEISSPVTKKLIKNKELIYLECQNLGFKKSLVSNENIQVQEVIYFKFIE